MTDPQEIDADELALLIARTYSLSMNDARQIARDGLDSFDGVDQ